jgi:hypothetical protein
VISMGEEPTTAVRAQGVLPRLRVGWLALSLFIPAGCRMDMHDQPRVEAYEASEFFSDGKGSRELPEGTLAQGFLGDDDVLTTGKLEGQDSEVFPFAVTRKVLGRGQERHDVFCSPCHDRVGTGNGIIVQRGMKRPPSFHVVHLREAPPG